MTKSSLNQKQQLAIQGLVLTTFQSKVTGIVKDIDFLFKGIKRLEGGFQNRLKLEIKKMKQHTPGLTNEEYFQMLSSNKKVMVDIIEFKRKEAIYAQCIILQISGWIKSVFKEKVKLLSQYSKKSKLAWIDIVYKLGPQYGTKFWAASVEIASNYVRHKDEWHYNCYDFDKNKKMVTRKNILGTMKQGKPRKNAQFLVDLGIPQKEIFGIGNDASLAILKIISSDTLKGLRDNCQKWLDALNSFTSLEMNKIIIDLK